MTLIDYYLEIHQQQEQEHGKNTCVLMQVGHFYEVYAVDNYKEQINHENIKRLSDIMNVQMTRKNKNKTENNRGNPIMIGVNLLSVEKYIQILTNHNYTIVMVDQVTDPPEPERKITNIISPGTNISYVSNGDSSNLMVVYIEEVIRVQSLKETINIGMSVVDLSIGKTTVYETFSKKDDSSISLDDTYRFIQVHNPREIVIYMNTVSLTEKKLRSYLELDRYVVHFREETDKKYVELSGQKEILEKVYPDRGMLSVIEYIDMEFNPYALISFVASLDFAYKHNESIITRIGKPNIWEEKRHLVLTNSSVTQLNLVDNNYNNYSKFSSLFGVVNNTSTAIGKRLLRETLLNPIINSKELQERYLLTESMMGCFEKFEEHLKKISDIERLHRKICLKLIQPADFVSLDISYKNIIDIVSLCENSDTYLKELLPDKKHIHHFKTFMGVYLNYFDMDEICKYHIGKITNSFFNKGIYPEIDELKFSIDRSYSRIEIISRKLSNLLESGSNTVKYEYSISEGHSICLTDNRAKILKQKFIYTKHSTIKIDEDFVINPKEIVFIKSKKKTQSKIVCDKIEQLSKNIIEKTDKIGFLVREKFLEVMDLFGRDYIASLKPISDFVGLVDMYKSNAKTASIYGYSKPIIKKQTCSYIEAKDIRHPIIERIQTDVDYVTNDISIGDTTKGVLLFGTNASGKSSLMKALGLNIIMAQSGMFVPCSKFEFSPYRYLFTRINNNDNLFKGHSSFAVEMNELRGILKRSDKSSLVLGDELCSGTESVSALSIFASSVQFLVNKQSSFIFATHLHELCKLDIINQLMDSIKLYHLKVIYDKEKDTLIYNRKLTEGSGDAIYGLEVCRSMDMDDEFLETAKGIRKKIMGKDSSLLSGKKSSYNSDIYVDMCKVCRNPAVDVHHIKFQCTADDNSMIGHIQKDSKSNLVQLCKKCHNDVHNSRLEINGYIHTGKGIELDFRYINTDEYEAKKKNRKKFNEDQVKEIKDFIGSCGELSNKFMCLKLEKDKNIKMSIGILAKIRNNTY
jgi:DNA mismatch repair protein MutS